MTTPDATSDREAVAIAIVETKHCAGVWEQIGDGGKRAYLSQADAVLAVLRARGRLVDPWPSRYVAMAKEAGGVPVEWGAGGKVTAMGTGGTTDDGTRLQQWNSANDEACRSDANPEGATMGEEARLMAADAMEGELRRQIDQLRESWKAARHIVFAARAVLAAPTIALAGQAMGNLRARLTAYDQRHHDATAPGGSSGEAIDHEKERRAGEIIAALGLSPPVTFRDDNVCGVCGAPWGMRHSETCRNVPTAKGNG